MCVLEGLKGIQNARDNRSALHVVEASSIEVYGCVLTACSSIKLEMQVEKAGATVLFEDPAKRGNTIGVVVNPVRISSLKDFGTPSVVADKLIAAERKKVTIYHSSQNVGIFFRFHE